MNEYPICTALPGVFYRCPSPGAPAFVQEGDVLIPETVIGIVELMKQFNEVQAGVAGTLAAFLVDDGDVVDTDQALATVVHD